MAYLVSIHVCSNRPQQIVKFIDSFEKNASDKTSFEIIVNCDIDDFKMMDVLRSEQKKRSFTLKYINTFDGGFYDSHKFYNDMIEQMDENAYFAVALSDEMLVQTKNWDKLLKSYMGFFPDDLFRVKCSRFKLRNYIDPWECGFAPCNITFTTTKWLRINNDWASCFSIDTFQQYVSYYLFTSNPFQQTQFYRDIPDFTINFTGDVAAIGEDEEKRYKRIQGSLKSFSVLNSPKMQKEMKCRAMKIKANILLEEECPNNKKLSIYNDIKNNQILIVDPFDKTLRSFSYRVNQFLIRFRLFYRMPNFFVYGGGGRDRFSVQSVLENYIRYLSYRYTKLKNIHNNYNYIKGWLSCNVFKKILENKS